MTENSPQFNPEDLQQIARLDRLINQWIDLNNQGISPDDCGKALADLGYSRAEMQMAYNRFAALGGKDR